MNKRHILIASATTLAITLTSLVGNLCTTARADQVDLHRILDGGQRCDHVMGLLLKHGVNNSNDMSNTPDMIHALGAFAIPSTELGDLQLMQITQDAEVAPGCGPKFQVMIQNTSTRDVCGFRVTIVGLFGRIMPHSPSCTVTIDKICAGAAVEVPMELPIESLAMGNHNGQILGFQRVLVVVDSYDQFMECDEANNLRVFDRNTIPVATIAVQESATTAAIQSETQMVSQAAPSTDIQSVEAAPQNAAPQNVGVDVGNAGVSAPAAATPQPVSDDLKSALEQFSQQSGQQVEEQSAATTN
ncbi:hypothetical protein [Stieleria varia]|uniref:CARDB domain-containing protein n=1 Tax=Stieleria varia TaxID=2528005 RepID=A0A5C6A3M0_9BACT|nr:hypothetical protein [Stieleria varia]TWT93937.1 hypothetical protein Pla52n_57650 [Stieleria varia]